MFNMTKIRASHGSGKSFYANHLSSNDYYSEHERVRGYWLGELADAFGLRGEIVTSREFSLFQKNINLDQQFFARSWLGDIFDVLGDGLHHLQKGKFPASRPLKIRLHGKKLFLHLLLPVLRIQGGDAVLVQENERKVIQGALIAIQSPVVDFLLEPFSQRPEFVPVDQAFFAGGGLSADVNIESHDKLRSFEVSNG